MKTTKRDKEGHSGSSGKQALLSLYAACVTNAEDLIEEAEILFERLRYPRAYALAFTALEEIGKAHFVADFYTGVVARSEFENAFSSHQLKIAYLTRWLAIGMPPEGGWPEEATNEYNMTEADPTFRSRNRALYVEYGVDFRPACPSDRVTREIAERAIKQVRDELYEFTLQEYMGHQIGSKGRFK